LALLNTVLGTLNIMETREATIEYPTHIRAGFEAVRRSEVEVKPRAHRPRHYMARAKGAGQGRRPSHG